MSKQYNQFKLEIRFDAAELALLRKLVRQASLAAFEQKHLEEHKELEELLFRWLYSVQRKSASWAIPFKVGRTTLWRSVTPEAIEKIAMPLESRKFYFVLWT